jgi:chitinase
LPDSTRLASLSASEVLLSGDSSSGGSFVTPPATGGGSTGTGTDTGTTTPPGSGGGTSPLPPGRANSGNAADALWGESFFAPSVDMGLYPVPDLDGLAHQHGVGLFTLGFIQATSSGEAAWAGLSALSLTSSNSQAVALRQKIRQLQAVGGDAMVSFGGVSGASASDLAKRYGQVVDTLALNRIDFDIEGAALANRAANTHSWPIP